MKKKEIDEFGCDICKKIFYRKWVNRENSWTKINEVSYWLNGKAVDNYKILCRACLNNWFEKIYRKYPDLVPSEKRKRFQHYRYTGLFDAGKELYKE